MDFVWGEEKKNRGIRRVTHQILAKQFWSNSLHFPAKFTMIYGKFSSYGCNGACALWSLSYNGRKIGRSHNQSDFTIFSALVSKRQPFVRGCSFVKKPS